MNDAFILNISLGILTKENELWAQVTRGKYHDRGVVLDQQPIVCDYDTTLWKKIAASWPLLKSNIQFSLEKTTLISGVKSGW